MIKRIRFASRSGATNDFSAGWPAAVATAQVAPPGVRPARVVACTVLPDVTPDLLHEGIGIEWFDDTEHLSRYERWLTSPPGQRVGEMLSRVLDLDASPLFLAEEHVLRGTDWMEERWRTGGARLKHMAIATRAAGLTPAQFSDLWRTRAGKVGTVVIPDEARGRAYVQNHPLPPPGASWVYDALNEVYFDAEDLEGVRARIAFFAETMKDRGEEDLVSKSWFLVAREDLL